MITLTYFLVTYLNQEVETQELRANISTFEPIFLFVNFLLIIFSFVINFNTIKKAFSKIKRNTWFLLIAVFLIAIFLRTFVAPSTHRVFFDEDIYLDIGKEILINNEGSLCNYGFGNECYEYDLMKWPNGFPFLLAVTYFFLGISEAVAFGLTILLGSLTPVLVFLTAYLLTKNEKVSLFSALFFTLVPVHIIWSATTAAEPIFVFFTSLAAFCILLSFESNDWKSHLLALSSLAYAVQIKAEGLLLFPIFGLMFLLLDKNLFKKLEEKKFLLLWIIFFALLVPYFVHMNNAFETEAWGSSGEKFALKYAQENIPINAIFWVHGYKTIEHPILLTIFALLGSFYLLSKNKRVALILLFWFFVIFIFYASFYAGSVKYGVDVRYALSGYPPFVILAGFGAYSITEGLKNKKYKKIMSLLIVSLSLITFVYYVPSIVTPTKIIQEARQARVYHDLAVDVAGELDDDCYVLSHVPSIYLVMGKGSLQTWNGQNKQVMDDLFSKTDCIVFDDGFWCNLQPYKSSVCKHIFDNYNLELIDQYSEKNGPTYTFFRVSK